MADKAAADKLHLGFLRVISMDAGYVGGLLVTNRIGRPLEFQCTTPVRPNKTQEVLYGPTLEAFLYSEVLGRTLLDRMAVKPDILLIDQPEMLAIREICSSPVLLLSAKSSKNGSSVLDDARTQDGFEDDSSIVERLRKLVPGSADLMEPLDRVREALTEALRAAA
ncbi:hypothetical protein Pan44_47380 [Caulifigura coniformis]|uniref:Uncharacterized protein n=1 Tax=Caulifigura coniformis TaxID=2527983 RepID=A0A517SKN5_9PLAN|nr:hypothetical protein [Caulifigura coniformis]QDT56681.1 hypothetical protein Pan44_47380 [Caulifigura coniformis]